jgi:antitoxin component YwqK of YwqJK toxin-antitoxin module
MRVNIDETDINDDQYVLYNGELYTGTVFELLHGKIHAEIDYVDGIREGMSRLYYPDGTLESEESFRDGLGHGRQRYWYPNGQLKEEMFVDMGVMTSTRKWAEDGTLLDPQTRQPFPESPSGGGNGEAD